MAGTQLTRKEWEVMLTKLSDRNWRLRNLYYITDKFAKKTLFSPNNVQQYIEDHFWFNELILKSRQRGVSTYFMLTHLDDAMFLPEYQIGVIAHKEAEASKLVNKVRYAFKNLPEELQDFNPVVKDNKKELVFKNGSSIYASTSYRSGSLQKLHVTEFGFTCAKYPEKAEEIVTGAFNALPIGGSKIIESTAMGKAGYFPAYVDTAKKNMEMGIRPNKMAYFLMFFDWTSDPDCRLSPEGVVTYPRHEEYFKKLQADTGRILTPEQRAFWIMKEADLGPKIKSEYPSTIQEAFEQNIEGSYYSQQMTQARIDGRITKVPYMRGIPVNTFWDIGKSDFTTIWFCQRIGREYHIIDYMQSDNEGFEYFHNAMMNEKPYQYGIHIFPHDIMQGFQLKGVVTRWGTVQELFGAKNCKVCPNQPPSREDGINAARRFLSTCLIDQSNCEEGIDCLDNYRKAWDSRLGCYKNEPVHDEYSHGADSFRYLAVWELLAQQIETNKQQKQGNRTSLGSKKKKWGPAYC
jgi:hypothetical protein